MHILAGISSSCRDVIGQDWLLLDIWSYSYIWWVHIWVHVVESCWARWHPCMICDLSSDFFRLPRISLRFEVTRQNKPRRKQPRILQDCGCHVGVLCARGCRVMDCHHVSGTTMAYCQIVLAKIIKDHQAFSWLRKIKPLVDLWNATLVAFFIPQIWSVLTWQVIGRNGRPNVIGRNGRPKLILLYIQFSFDFQLDRFLMIFPGYWRRRGLQRIDHDRSGNVLFRFVFVLSGSVYPWA